MDAGLTNCPYIESPAFHGDGAVMVTGDSMLPVIAPGQVVTFRRVEDPPEDNTLAVIEATLRNGKVVRVLKCVRAIPNRRRWESLELTSYNQSVRPDRSQVYPPYRIGRERVRAICPVLAIIFPCLTNEPRKGGIARARVGRSAKNPPRGKRASGRLYVGTPL